MAISVFWGGESRWSLSVPCGYLDQPWREGEWLCLSALEFLEMEGHLENPLENLVRLSSLFFLWKMEIKSVYWHRLSVNLRPVIHFMLQESRTNCSPSFLGMGTDEWGGGELRGFPRLARDLKEMLPTFPCPLDLITPEEGEIGFLIRDDLTLKMSI